MREVDINQNSGRILESYDSKAPANQKKGIAAYGGKFGGVAKFFGLAVDVKIGDKTITVNKKSLEKYMDRNGQSFHYNKQNAEQLGQMLEKVAPKANWERETVIKQLARTEDVKAQDKQGSMSLSAKNVSSFLNTLEEFGIAIPDGMKHELEQMKSEMVTIKKEFVDQLRESAKKIMSDEGIGVSKWASDIQQARAARTSGMQKPSEPVNAKNLAQKIKELRLPKNGSPLEKCKAFFGNEAFKEIIDFAKTDPKSAKVLMKELFGNQKTDSKTVKEGIEWVLRGKGNDVHASLQQLIATAQGK